MILTPTFKKLTPNLIVEKVERSLGFYVDVLGFARGFTVPEESPLVFGSVVSGNIEIFFNDKATAIHEYPSFAGRPAQSCGRNIRGAAGQNGV